MSAVTITMSPLVRRLTAPNPSPMTGAGTNTYLIGADEVAVIDPGPDDPEHIQHIVDALGGTRLIWILLTHTHPDHAMGAPRLARHTAAPVLAYDADDVATGFGIRADRGLADGQTVKGSGFTLFAIHTPGHASNHLCVLLREEGVLFSGDLIMSGSTVVIAPPDGDMGAYMRSLEHVKALGPSRIYPGHGDPIDNPQVVIDEYLHHRRMREQQVLEALHDRPRRIDDIVAGMYSDVPRSLHGMAALSVYAHLLKLRAEGRVAGTDRNAEWMLVRQN